MIQTQIDNQSDPIALACLDMILATEKYEAERLKRARLTSLLARTDRILASLEELNLMEVGHAPEVFRVQMTALIADLPFGFQLLISDHPSPTELIDLVFDVQETLLRYITPRLWEVDDRISA